MRFSNADAKACAELLSESGLNCVFVPRIPLSEITKSESWIYMAVAKYCILKRYSEYDFLEEIPAENTFDNNKIIKVRNILQLIFSSILNTDYSKFVLNVKYLAENVGYILDDIHIQLLYKTILDESLHAAFEIDKYKHIAITFHSSKGLEFDQVIIFAEDYYNLNNEQSIYNHYVAVTRAKSKLIIVRKNSNRRSDQFTENIESIFKRSNLSLKNLVSIG